MNRPPVLISPSLLSADFMHLSADVEMIERSEADWLHLDIMDGVFVPNISYGFPLIRAVRSHCSRLLLDAHFMIVRPETYIRQAADCGIGLMTVHAEACTHLHRTLQEIHAAGMRAGVALNPATPLCAVEEVLGDTDVVLLMSVNPGFAGQKFIPTATDKVRRLRAMIDAAGYKTLIEVDGGVDDHTAPLLREAGADALVSGSHIFRSPDPAAAIAALHRV